MNYIQEELAKIKDADIVHVNETYWQEIVPYWPSDYASRDYITTKELAIKTLGEPHHVDSNPKEKESFSEYLRVYDKYPEMHYQFNWNERPIDSWNDSKLELLNTWIDPNITNWEKNETDSNN